MRILVVDDNEDSAFTLAEVLKARGYATRVAYDAPAALNIASEFCRDLAFFDIGLPVMDGYELRAPTLHSRLGCDSIGRLDRVRPGVRPAEDNSRRL